MVGMQVGKVPPALPMLQAELDLSRVIAGLIASSFYGIGAVLGVVGGLLVDRLGIRRMVVVGGAAMALAGLAGGFAESGAPLLAARIVEGFGFVTLTVVGPKMLVTATDAGVRRFLLGVWGTYMPVGIALSLVIATALLEPIGWRGLWFLNSGLILVFVLVFLWGAAPGRWQAPAVRGGSFDGAGVRATLARPGPWLFGASFAIFAVEWQALMAWLPTFLIETQASARSPAPRSSPRSSSSPPPSARWPAPGSCSVASRGGRCWRSPSQAWESARRRSSRRSRPSMPRSHSPFVSPWPAVPCPPSVSKAASRMRPAQRRSPWPGGFVAQGAALGAVLGPPLLAAVTEALGGWEAAWWTMLVWSSLGLAVVAGVWRADTRLARLAAAA